jgi:hypothetical protein
METVTQTNASGAEESASAAEEMNAQAESLKESVRELQALVSDAEAPSAKVSAPVKHLRMFPKEEAPKVKLSDKRKTFDKAKVAHSETFNS